MRDHLRRYRARRDARTPGYPGPPTGTVARPLATLAALLSGIVGRKRPPLPQIAPHVPEGTQPARRGQRFARWGRNDRSTADSYCVPSAQGFLAHLALQTRGLVLDGRVRGRGGGARRLHGVDTGRAWPLAWLVRPGQTGHCPEACHLALGEQGHKLIPAGASVVLLGDGACDGVALQHPLAEAGGASGWRTGRHMTASGDGAPFRLAPLGVCRKPGPLLECKEGRFPGEASGPIMRICGWAQGEHDPLYVGTQVPAAEPACRV